MRTTVVVVGARDLLGQRTGGGGVVGVTGVVAVMLCAPTANVSISGDARAVQGAGASGEPCRRRHGAGRRALGCACTVTVAVNVNVLAGLGRVQVARQTEMAISAAPTGKNRLPLPAL